MLCRAMDFDSKPYSDIKSLRRLWTYVWPRNLPGIRFRVMLAVLFLVLSKSAIIAAPLFFQGAVDALTDVRLENLMWVPISMILAYALARSLNIMCIGVQDAAFVPVAQRAIRQAALNVFNHLHRLGLRYHLQRQTGGLSHAIQRGTKGIQMLLEFSTLHIFPTLLEIILVGAVLWINFDYRVALITFVTLAGYIAFTLQMTEWRMRFVRQMNDTDGDANTKAIDSLLNFETVKYFGNEVFEADRYDESLKAYEQSAVKARRSLAFLNIGQSIILGVGTASSLTLVCYQVFDHVITIGGFVAINAYLIQVYIPLFNLGFSYREIKLSLVNIETMFSLLSVGQEIKDKPQAPDLNFQGGHIAFKDVSFAYEDDRPILKNVSFSVPAGKSLAIVGTSGAGKSTIARLLFRFYDVKSGAILIDDQDLRDVRQQSLHQHIGVVPQDTVLFNDTIAYNISYGNLEASYKEVEAAAKQARIHEFIKSLPQGYQTCVGERGLKLSGGEKQRVAIARTLLKKPKIFLFDEATSALDTRTERVIQKNLEDISYNRTTLMIAHRLSTVVHADMIIVLDCGEIAERGTHADLLAKGGLYKQMWERQQHKRELQAALADVKDASHTPS